jgi:hypothetical protein
MTNPDDLLTATAASRLADLSATYLRQLANQGKIPILRTTAGTRLYRRGDIESWLAARKANPPRRGPRPRIPATEKRAKLGKAKKEKASTQ